MNKCEIKPIADFLMSLDYTDIITCIVSIWMAVVATMALNTWKRQSKAKKQTDFLDEITDAVHKYINDLYGPTEVVKFIKFGIESHLISPLLQEKDVENPEIVAYVKQSGERDAKFLNEQLEKCNQSVFRIHTLMAKGQVLGFKNYDVCHESCRMLTWQYERIQALSFMIGNVHLNWKNEEVQKTLKATTSLEHGDIQKYVAEYNKKFLTFVKKNYEEIFK
jgi:hypothetical protein